MLKKANELVEQKEGKGGVGRNEESEVDAEGRSMRRMLRLLMNLNLPGSTAKQCLLDLLDDDTRYNTGARLYPSESLLAHLDFLARASRPCWPPTESSNSKGPITCSTCSCPTPTPTRSIGNWAPRPKPPGTRRWLKNTPSYVRCPPARGGPLSGASEPPCAWATTARFLLALNFTPWTLRPAPPSSAACAMTATFTTSATPRTQPPNPSSCYTAQSSKP